MYSRVGMAAFHAGCIINRVYFKQGVFYEGLIPYNCNISRVHYMQGVF